MLLDIYRVNTGSGALKLISEGASGVSAGRENTQGGVPQRIGVSKAGAALK